MTYPFDQIATFAGANSELTQKLFDIARVSGERQAKIGAAALAAISDQAKDLKPGVPSFLPSANFTDAIKEAEQGRQAIIAETTAAIEAWQAKIKDLFSPEEGQKQVSSLFQTWSQPLFSSLTTSTETTKSASPASAKTKVAETSAA